MQPGGVDPTLRREVLAFRIAELKHVAGLLHLKKTGNKAELQERVLEHFKEISSHGYPNIGLPLEQASRVVHEAWCRMMNRPINTPSDQSARSSLRQEAMPRAAAPEPGYRYQPPSAGQMAGYYGEGQRLAQLLQQQQMAQQAQQMAQQAAQQVAFQAQQAQQAHSRQAEWLQQAQHSAEQAQQAHAQAEWQQQQHLMHGSGGKGGSSTKPIRVRCICASPHPRGPMAMCQGKGCGIWQHIGCLGARAPLTPAATANFLCEGCRARLADPFWEATEQVVAPSALKPQPGLPLVVTLDGMQHVQRRDLVFYLNQQQLAAAQRDPENNRVQFACILVGDEVSERYHWPRNIDLKINNMPHRPYSRSMNAPMGINQRDDVCSIASMVVRGRNTLTLSAPDSSTWVVMLQLARRRSLEEVKALMAAPEELGLAVARVRRQVAGDDNSDDDLLVSHQVVSLKDPMSGQRMKVPARFAGASGLQPFDLDSLLSMVQRSRKWQDPTNLQNSTVEALQVDTYVLRVLQCLRSLPAITDIEVSAEGQWRPDGSGAQWFDIAADPASVAASLKASAGSPVKLEQGAEAAAAGGNTTAGAAANAGGNGGSGKGSGGAGKAAGREEELIVPDSDSDEEEECAEEELRKAAAAVRKPPSALLSGQKRKAEEPEVIDLLSSDDEDAPPMQPRQQAQQQARQAQQQARQAPPPQAQQPRPGASPLRIRLPVRPQPPQQPLSPSAQRPPGAAAASGAGVSRESWHQSVQQDMQQQNMQQQLLQMQQQRYLQRARLGGSMPTSPQLQQQPWLQPGDSFFPAPGAAPFNQGFLPASHVMQQMQAGGSTGTGAGAATSPVLAAALAAARQAAGQAGWPAGQGAHQQQHQQLEQQHQGLHRMVDPPEEQLEEQFEELDGMREELRRQEYSSLDDPDWALMPTCQRSLTTASQHCTL